MTISVIVPCFNAAEVLKTSLPAMAAQTHDAEWVFVDDGSTDGTSEVIQGAISEGFDATLIQFPHNRGRAAARNVGIAGTSGEVVVFLDADAVPTSDFVAGHARVYEDDPEAVATVSRIQPHASVAENPYTVYLRQGSRGPSAGARTAHWQHFITTASSVRRGALEQVGAFDESVSYGEDTDLALRLEVAFPGRLRLAEPGVALLDTGSLATALKKLRFFARWTLPNLLERHPHIAAWPGFRVVLSGPRTDLPRALIRKIAASRALAALTRRSLPHLPKSLVARAVRLLLAHTLVRGFDERPTD